MMHVYVVSVNNTEELIGVTGSVEGAGIMVLKQSGPATFSDARLMTAASLELEMAAHQAVVLHPEDGSMPVLRIERHLLMP